MQQITYRPVKTLEAADLAAVRALIALSEAHEGLHLKIMVDQLDAQVAHTLNAMLAEDGAQVIGYAAIDPGDPAEICGTVHPAYRSQGIARLLLAPILSEISSHGVGAVIVCEEASPSGQRFLRSVMAKQDHSEFRMELGKLGPTPPRYPNLYITRATDGDIPTLTQLLATGFGDDPEGVRRILTRELSHADHQIYLATIDDEAVGTIKAIDMGNQQAGIYAFAIDPDWQSMGLGRQILTWFVQHLQVAGWRSIMLEVDTTNTHALNLYRTCGFHEIATYGYYRPPPWE